MSKKNRNTLQRNRDFGRCCLEVYKAMHAVGRTPTLREVVRRAIACRPQAFYIDTVYAYNKLCRMQRSPGEAASTPVACMWRQLAALVEAERLRSGSSILRALGDVLNRERPASFAISVDEGVRIARQLFIGYSSHRPRRCLL